MLDRIDAGGERGINAGSTVRVCADAAAEPVRRLDNRPDLVADELLVDAGAQVGEHAASSYEFDGVRPLRHLSSYGSAAGIDTIADANVRLYASAHISTISIDLAVPTSR